MMDPRALEAIVAALPYVAEGAEHVSRTVGEGAGQAVGAALVTEAFGKLKSVLRKKSGGDGRVTESVDELVADPESEGRRMVLAERLKAAGAEEDPEVRAAARELLDAVRAQPGGEQHAATAMTAVGKYIAQAGPGATASVWVSRPEGREG
jgi:hypothetical protein